MDNVNQGNAAGTTFNLRAYGLANLLLQNNIPLKWAIKPGKDKDEEDFTANVMRIAGTQGVAAGNVSFSGGAFIVTQEYDNPSVRALITTFNGSGICNGLPPVGKYLYIPVPLTPSRRSRLP